METAGALAELIKLLDRRHARGMTRKKDRAFAFLTNGVCEPGQCKALPCSGLPVDEHRVSLPGNLGERPSDTFTEFPLKSSLDCKSAAQSLNEPARAFDLSVEATELFVLSVSTERR